MRYIFLSLFLLVAAPSWADPNVQAFVNQVYSAYWKQVFLNKHSQRAETWVNHHPNYFSDTFIRTLNIAVKKANKLDPQLGLDHDVIICAQDGPDHGYHAGKVEKQNGGWRVTLQADEPGWEPLIIDVIQVGDTLKIDDICDERKKNLF